VATTNDIKNGSVLNLDGQLWAVVEFQHVNPKRGRLRSNEDEKRALRQSCG